LSILTGIVIAFALGRHRWKTWGGSVTHFENIALVSVIAGIVGARIYWIIIEWPLYFGPDGTWYKMFFVWEGGLGIWGGIAGGFLSGWLMCRKYSIRFLRLADAIAPAFLIAQGIGRLGNWWNQELYGLPSTLPWALEIDPLHRVAGYSQYATFHPTFLYEMLWDFAGAAALLLLERRLRLGRGKLFASYIVTYATGRFLIEFLRIDPVATVWGLRVNAWPTLAGAIFGVVLLIWLLRNRPGPNEIETVASDADNPGSDQESDPDTSVSDQDKDAATAA